MYKIINSKYIWCPINGILKDHSILIKSNKIHRIDQYKNLNILKYKKINLKNSILMPGLVNSHIHLELNWVKKKLKYSSEFTDWLSQIIDLKKVLSKNKLIKESIKQAIEECSGCGVTTIGEIASYNGLDISIIKKSGLRCSYFYEIANSNSLNFEKNILKIEKKINKSSLIELKVFPHSIYSLDTVTWKKCKKFSTKNKLSICTHLSESREEIKFIKGKKNKFDNMIFKKLKNAPKVKRKSTFTPLKYLKGLGVVNKDLTLVHMNNLSNEDKSIIKKNHLKIVLCPRSNLFLNEKLPDLKFFLNYHSTGLGTDGLSSNDDLNFINEMSFLYLNSKKLKVKNLKEKILSISTIGGAKCLGLDKKIGSIEINKRADLIAFEIKDRNPFDSIIFREGKNISFKMIDGKIKKFQ